MINQEELAICRRRSHTVHATTRGWLQCEACGMWLREMRTTEEREDTPPMDEIDPALRTKWSLDAAERAAKKKARPE